MPTERIGLYPGTFDPITLGHYDIIKRAAKLVDTLVIGVAMNPGKNPLFSVEERCAMALKMTEEFPDTNFEVRPFQNLLMHFAEECNASVIIRGLRAVSDFEYEFQMVGMNRRLNADIETVFLMASDQHQFIASSLVKEIAFLGGDITPFVSKTTATKIVERVAKIKAAK
ncbi:pantetheine-phosphate adenylyltransferase [Sneathiella chinensis]|uniref:Phosphopantetheine adenylyltransferase n=1 Tax=Sneathiella chinensis TaxID=349750 RepID=A0ABQ5U8B6_9PROT|nr:pantetheine-phosphate adenylyltransferase [Sneathiella chinensis]GLQ07435.1 phosphopantetheine adenylyltransferase [Sneathiella chinensis]